jgi:hypothetical protein
MHIQPDTRTVETHRRLLRVVARPPNKGIALDTGTPMLHSRRTTVETAADIALTVDADTLLAEGAIGAVRQAFSCDPELVGVTGIITPVCRPSVAACICRRSVRGATMRLHFGFGVGPPFFAPLDDRSWPRPS